MNVLNQFSIPYKGLGIGVHDLKFKVEDHFFSAFENPHIENGNVDVDVVLEKGHGMSSLEFIISGTTNAVCDRCTESMILPLKGRYRLLIKFGEEEDSNDEVLFVHPEISILNIAQIIYEYICLSIPMIKTCDDDISKESCNKEVLKRLDGDDDRVEEEEESSVWGDLKNMKFD